MRWPERLRPIRMTRIAVVAPVGALRDALARVADAGVVELDLPESDQAEPGRAGRFLRGVQSARPAPALAPHPPDLSGLAEAGRLDLVAGEAELEKRAALAVRRGNVAALAGWTPETTRPRLAARLAEVGAAAVPLPFPRGTAPPTLLGGGSLRGSMAPLVETYGTVPYADLDPTPLAAASYMFMFGMMFGDVGHGLMLVACGVALLTGRPRFLNRFRRAWPFVLGAGVAATAFGFAYGELFGPTDVLPVLWLRPLESPVELLVAAVCVGAVLLAAAYSIGVVNRWREGGWPLALYEPSGIAGASCFLGAGAIAAGVYAGLPVLTAGGGIIATAGLTLAFTGFRAGAEHGFTGLVQASVELFDLVIRLGANVLSFARLAAFGLTHAALAGIVWSATAALWAGGGPLPAGAVFVVGTAVTFALEVLVAGIQALRLEYYELFSRLFLAQGRPFQPWHIPVIADEECPSCPQN